MQQAPLTEQELAARRAAARRTALVFAGVALAVYAGFMVLNAVMR